MNPLWQEAIERTTRLWHKIESSSGGNKKPLLDEKFFLHQKSIIDKAVPSLRGLLEDWPGEPPLEFEPGYYKKLYPGGDKNIPRGALTSPAAHMLGLTAVMMKKAATVLEIGPYGHPADLTSFIKVKYFDLYDQQTLRKKINDNPMGSYTAAGVPFIDYSSPTGDLSVVNEKFDAVYSSHCLEHTTDLLGHLNRAAALLNPGGSYYLVIPDHRYCFDHYFPPTTVDDVLLAHNQRISAIQYESVYLHHIFRTHNHVWRHWRGDHEDAGFMSGRLEDRLEEAGDCIKKQGGPGLGGHNWRLTPDSFRFILESLRKRGLLNFEISRIYDTPFSRCEFTAILKTNTSSPPRRKAG